MYCWARRCSTCCPSITLIGSGASASGAGGSLGATRGSIGAQNENQSHSFLVCKGRDKQDPDAASIGPSSLGQVANQWRTTARGLNIHLKTATPERVLENFEMGAADDIKQNIMLHWCRKNARFSNH